MRAVNDSPLSRFVVRKRTLFSLLVPIVFVLFAHPDTESLLMGLAFVIAGQGIRLWAAGCISKNRELACCGPFAHVRNPLYLGSLFIATGYCFMSDLWWSFLVTAVFYYWFYFGTIYSEEQHLETVLGDAYRKYRSEVPRLRPRLARFVSAFGPGFSWSRVWYNREYQSIMGSALFSLAFVLLWLYRHHLPIVRW